MNEDKQAIDVRKVLFNDRGDAVRLIHADGTERIIPLRYRLDVEGVEPLAHGLLTMSAAVVEALDRVRQLETNLLQLAVELELAKARKRSWWQRFTKWWNTGLGW